MTQALKFRGFLEPMDRISEVLFGVIMVLTFTGALSVATADRLEVREVLVGALGCNLAWGVIDAGLYLMGRLQERGRTIQTFRAVRDTTDEVAARRIVAETLPAYAPEINPDELVWGWSKYGRLANLAAEDTDQLRDHVIEDLTHLQEHPYLLASFVDKTKLPFAA